MDDCFENDTGCTNLNLSLLDDSTMRDNEFDNEQTQEDHVTIDDSQQTVTLNNVVVGHSMQDSGQRQPDVQGKN